MKAVVEVLQSSAADIAASGVEGGGIDGSGDIKDASISLFTWGRFVKDVMNARTTGGKTPLMLACEQGYVRCLFPLCIAFLLTLRACSMLRQQCPRCHTPAQSFAQRTH